MENTHDERKKGYLEDFSHLALLWKGTVVLYGEDDGHVRIDECRPVNCFHHILEDHGRDFILRKCTPSQIWDKETQWKPMLMRFTRKNKIYSIDISLKSELRWVNEFLFGFVCWHSDVWVCTCVHAGLSMLVFMYISILILVLCTSDVRLYLLV